jgi:myo-inositol-1(or 4)-monophosphatase
MDEVKSIITNVGRVLKERYSQSFSYNEKGRYDLVSDVDLEIEELLISNLKSIYSESSLYSEECGEMTNSGSLRWIIDPIDGTANFIFGVPYFNISLSLEVEKQIVEAYILNPMTDELYYTDQTDNCSYLNDKILQVSGTENIADTLIVFGFSANFTNINRYYNDWRHLFTDCKKGMGLLSPALNICNIARGRTDCFIDFGSNMEGHAGAALILQKAGGTVLNYDLSQWDYTNKGIVAGNMGIIGKMKNR